MGNDETKRVRAEIDAETHAILKEKLEHGELSATIRDVANTIAYGEGWDRRTLIDKRIERKREELRSLRSDRRDIDAAIETAEEELRELERDRERIETKAEQFEGALWSLEQSFRAGELGHLFEGHARVQSLADEFDEDAADIFKSLRERNPDVPDYAFEELAYTARRFDGLSDDDVATPVDERGGSP